MLDLFSRLRQTAEKHADKTAIIYRDFEVSYADLFAAADSLAAGFSRGKSSGRRKVGLVASRDAEFVVALLGLMQAGVTAVPLSPALRGAELAKLADQLALDEVFLANQFSGLFPRGTADREIEFPTVGGRSSVWIRHALQADSEDSRRTELSKRGVSTIRWSSGTTGRAKGIMLSDDAVWARVKAHCEMHDLRQKDCILFLVSFDAALPALVAYLCVGASVVLEEAQNIEWITATSGNHGVTLVHATPFFYQMLLTHADAGKQTFPAIRYYISTGAPLASALSESFRNRFGREISQYYGIGECGPVFFNVSNDLPKRGSAGVLVSGCQAKLSGAGEPVDSDFGELWVRGPGLFEGYYEPWRPSEEILLEGWFCTGDLARLDSDGYYWMVGRTKDIINVAGTKIFPLEIEDILLSHPDVEEALVYAQSDARFGEVPHAKVKRRAGSSISERDLLRFVNDRLAILKALRKVEFVGELPRTSSGKIKRSERN